MASEPIRKCGYRKIGGLYLVSDGAGVPCHRLPIPLEVCPTCHGGVKQTRGWTWVEPAILGDNCDWEASSAASRRLIDHSVVCPACSPMLLGQKAGLVWNGTQFYTPAEFTREAAELGVSRRITAIPKGFKPGEHWVLVAHPKACPVTSVKPCDCGNPDGPDMHLESCAVYARGAGIFHVFKPSRIEKILADDAPQEEVDKWEARGVTVVKLPANDKDHRGTVYDKPEEEEESCASQP